MASRSHLKHTEKREAVRGLDRRSLGDVIQKEKAKLRGPSMGTKKWDINKLGAAVPSEFTGLKIR